MGKLIAVTNTGTTPIYIGDQVVVPGNTRHFDERLVPHQLRPGAAAPAAAAVPQPPADPIAEAFGAKPEELVARIREAAAMLPGDPEELRDALQRCKALAAGEESAQAPRIDVLEVLAELQLAIGEALVKAGEGTPPGPEGGEAADSIANAAGDATESAPPAGHEHAHAHRPDWHSLTKAELQAHLKKRHVKFETGANKDRLVELCKAHP